jgi:type IV pilus assembly protein PilC
MPNYYYTAKTFDGKTRTGNLPAKDIYQLAQALKSEGALLIKAISEEEKKRKSRFNFFISFSNVSAVEKIMLTRNLHIMIATGLSLVRGFDILSAQSKNQKLKRALLNIKEEINKGGSLSGSLAKYPDIFSELFQSMVKIGEESGTLEEVFKILSSQLEKEYELKSKVRGAMIYPCIILSTMLGVGAIITIVVLPRLNQFFSNLNVKLPFYTKAIIDFGVFAQQWWYLLLLSPVFLIEFYLLAMKTKRGRWVRDSILLKIPLFSPIIKKNNSALLIRSLSSLISSGVSLVKSLEITSGTVGNLYYKRALNKSAEKIKKGEKLSGALREYQNLFPIGAIEMMEVGEETGKTSTILKRLAEFYEKEVINIAENLSAAIEPILILFLGIVVAFFAFSIIEPMYSVLKYIQ